MAATRTPEGEPNLCPVCGLIFFVEASIVADDACCPACNTLVWLKPQRAIGAHSAAVAVPSDFSPGHPVKRRHRPDHVSARRRRHDILIATAAWFGVLSSLAHLLTLAVRSPWALRAWVILGAVALGLFLLAGTLQAVRLTARRLGGLTCRVRKSVSRH